MLIVVFVAPLAAYLPIPAMGGIILLVGYNLIDIHHIKKIIYASRLETTVLGVTFFSTLLLDLEFAIYVGMIFSLIFYLQKTSNPNIALLSPDPNDDTRRLSSISRFPHLQQCPQIKIVRIDDALYYGALENISDFMSTIYEGEEKHLILMAHGINFIDLAGADWLLQEQKRWQDKGGSLSICGLKSVAQDVLIKGGFKEKIGAANFYIKKSEAIKAVYQRLDKNICKACTARIFLECQEEFK